MSRKKKFEKREIAPDVRYGDVVIGKFINVLMYCGKKSLAERIVYQALSILEVKVGSSSLEVFYKALGNVKPDLEVRSRRVGGATYQIPIEVLGSRAQALAFRWILVSARKRSEKTMADRLAMELLDASAQKGGAVKKKEDVHKTAEANRAFAHYRW